MKILVVCRGGLSSSFVLAAKLYKVLPDYTYEWCGVREIPGKEFDIIVTFDFIKDAVKEIAPEGSKIRTIEEFNEFSKKALDNYLLTGGI